MISLSSLSSHVIKASRDKEIEQEEPVEEVEFSDDPPSEESSSEEEESGSDDE